MSEIRPLVIDQLCKYVSATESSVRRYIKKGLLPVGKKEGPRGILWWDANEIDAMFRASDAAAGREEDPHLARLFTLEASTIVARSQKWGDKFAGIYFLIKDREIVYVGQSMNVAARVSQHKKTRDFDSWSWIPCDTQDLLDLERAYIRKFRPELNMDAHIQMLRRKK